MHLSDKNCGFVTQILYLDLCIQFENKIYTVTIRSSGYFYWVYRCICDKTLFSSSVLQYLFQLFFSSSSPFVRRWQYQATNDIVLESWVRLWRYMGVFLLSLYEGTVACVATAETKFRSDTVGPSSSSQLRMAAAIIMYSTFRLKHARWRNR